MSGWHVTIGKMNDLSIIEAHICLQLIDIFCDGWWYSFLQVLMEGRGVILCWSWYIGNLSSCNNQLCSFMILLM